MFQFLLLMASDCLEIQNQPYNSSEDLRDNNISWLMNSMRESLHVGNERVHLANASNVEYYRIGDERYDKYRSLQDGRIFFYRNGQETYESEFLQFVANFNTKLESNSKAFEEYVNSLADTQEKNDILVHLKGLQQVIRGRPDFLRLSSAAQLINFLCDTAEKKQEFLRLSSNTRFSKSR